MRVLVKVKFSENKFLELYNQTIVVKTFPSSWESLKINFRKTWVASIENWNNLKTLGRVI